MLQGTGGENWAIALSEMIPNGDRLIFPGLG